MIAIEVNGEAREVAPGCTVQELVGQLELAQQQLALAVNRSVLPRQQWPQRELRAQDKVDIVRAIGGG